MKNKFQLGNGVNISSLIQLYNVTLYPETNKKKDSLKFILNLKR